MFFSHGRLLHGLKDLPTAIEKLLIEDERMDEIIDFMITLLSAENRDPINFLTGGDDTNFPFPVCAHLS